MSYGGHGEGIDVSRPETATGPVPDVCREVVERVQEPYNWGGGNVDGNDVGAWSKHVLAALMDVLRQQEARIAALERNQPRGPHDA